MKQFEETAVTVQRILKTVTFRQYITLAGILGLYLLFLISRGIGPEIMLEALSPIRAVGFVDDCPVLVMRFGGQRTNVIYQTFRRRSSAPNSYVVAAHSTEEWTQEDKEKICEQIDEDINKIRK